MKIYGELENKLTNVLCTELMIQRKGDFFHPQVRILKS